MGSRTSTFNAGFGPRFFAPAWALAAALGVAAAQTPATAPATKPAAPKSGPGTVPSTGKPAPSATPTTKPAAAPPAKPAVPTPTGKPAGTPAGQPATPAPKPAPAKALLPGQGQAANEAIRKRLSSSVDPALRAKYQRGDLATALVEVNARLAVSTNDTAHLFFRGTILGRRGEIPAALRDLQAVIRNEPAWADAYLARGEFRYRAGGHGEAVLDFQRARALNPDDGLAPFMEYLCLGLDGKAAEADKLRAAIAVSRENPAYYFIQAARAFQQGEAEKGAYLRQAALDLYPEHLTAPFHAPFLDQGWIKAE